MNVVFMLFRNVMMTVLMVFLPTLAAASGTESGKQAFSKANGYLLAFVLFKPVAAVIYALGLRFVNSPVGDKVNADDLTQAAIASLMGLAILLLAALSLPALMKFLVPVAATGAGGFSGCRPCRRCGHHWCRCSRPRVNGRRGSRCWYGRWVQSGRSPGRK